MKIYILVIYNPDGADYRFGAFIKKADYLKKLKKFEDEHEITLKENINYDVESYNIRC